MRMIDYKILIIVNMLVFLFKVFERSYVLSYIIIFWWGGDGYGLDFKEGKWK